MMLRVQVKRDPPAANYLSDEQQTATKAVMGRPVLFSTFWDKEALA